MSDQRRAAMARAQEQADQAHAELGRTLEAWRERSFERLLEARAKEARARLEAARKADDPDGRATAE